MLSRILIFFTIILAANSAPAGYKSGAIPIAFEENRGQADAQVRFLARQSDRSVLLSAREVSVVSHGKTRMKMRLANARNPSAIEGLGPTGGTSNYFIGTSENWRTGIPNYEKVLYRRVYQGIDLIFRVAGGKIEYDFVVQPGADPSRIAMDFPGNQALRIDPNGDLVVGGDVILAKPSLYQEHGGTRSTVDGRFSIHRHQVSFTIDTYDRARELVIDPVLNYSAIIAGSGSDDHAYGVATDSLGNAYVTGSTSSADFPVTSGALNAGTSNGSAYVYKLNPSGTVLLYSAIIAKNAYGIGIAVDGSGNAYVMGSGGTTFPTISGAPPDSGSNNYGGFAVKLSPTGNSLLYSTFLPSRYFIQFNGIAVDPGGNAYIVGQTFGGYLVTSGAFQTAATEGNVGFLTKLNSAGTALVYGTYLGGNSGTSWQSSVNAVAVDSLGNAYVAGSTTSPTFPTTAGAFQASASQQALGYGFVTKFSADGSSLVYSALLPGGSVSANGIAVDAARNAYVAGSSIYLTFPNLRPTDPIGGLFVSKLSADGTTMNYTRILGSTTVGGGARTTGSGVALDTAGNAWVTGTTTSPSYPVVSPIQAILRLRDLVTPSAVVSEFDPTGTLLFSTYLGGHNNGDRPHGIAVDPNGNAYVVGSAGSIDFPVTPGAAGGTSTNLGATPFIVSLSNSNACNASLPSPPPAFPASGGTGAVNVTIGSGCNWFLFSDLRWVAPIGNEASSGSGPANFSVQANTQPARSTVISIAGQPMTISQLNGCTYSLDATSANVPASGNPTLSVNLVTGFTCPWTISTPASWAPLVSGQSYESSAEFLFGVTANTGPDPRSVNMLIAGQPFVINQAGGYTCGFSLGFSSRTYGQAGTSGTIPVSTTSTCSWSAVSNTSWLHLTDVGSGSGDNPTFGTGSGFINIRLDQNNSGAPRMGTITVAGLTFTATQAAGGRAVQAVFRDSSNSVRGLTNPFTSTTNALGLFSGDPSAAEDTNGNLFAVARDTFNSLWVNEYVPNSVNWSGWQYGGGLFQGTPAIAYSASGSLWITARDQYNSYWMNSYTPGSSWGTWLPLYGVFASDPAITGCPDGSVYLVGKDNYNSLWSAHYIPGSGTGTGFQGWQFGGGIIQGKPSITCGNDNAVYIVSRDMYNSHWMARVTGNTWTGWYFGGAISSADPKIAALGGSLAVVILDPTQVVWKTTFTEGTGNQWQTWAQVGGILQDFAPAAVGGSLFLAGRSPGGDLWWWQEAGNQWTKIGNNGLAAGGLSAAPR